LFCFPYAGGSAAVFRGWAERLGTAVEVQQVQLPGRGARVREEPLSDVGSIVRELNVAIRPLLDRPFIFFGHSFGAFVAFELARRLRSELQLQPVKLIVSAARAPHLPLSHPPLHGLPEAEFIEQVRLRYDAIPPAIYDDAELRALLLPSLRADLTAYEQYAYLDDGRLECPVAGFAGADDNIIPQPMVAEWRRVTTGSFTNRLLPGDHFFLQSRRDKVVEAVAEELSACVA
jgi:medium-chain acyl-[acyl-carrier-protein] hydrolase